MNILNYSGRRYFLLPVGRKFTIHNMYNLLFFAALAVILWISTPIFLNYFNKGLKMVSSEANAENGNAWRFSRPIDTSNSFSVDTKFTPCVTDPAKNCVVTDDLRNLDTKEPPNILSLPHSENVANIDLTNETKAFRPDGDLYDASADKLKNMQIENAKIRQNIPLIFVGGMPRSGTTLMRAILDAHPLVKCGEETRVIPRILFMRKNWSNSKIEATRLEEAHMTKDVLNAATGDFILAILTEREKIQTNEDTFRNQNTDHRLLNDEENAPRLDSNHIKYKSRFKFDDQASNDKNNQDPNHHYDNAYALPVTKNTVKNDLDLHEPKPSLTQFSPRGGVNTRRRRFIKPHSREPPNLHLNKNDTLASPVLEDKYVDSDGEDQDGEDYEAVNAGKNLLLHGLDSEDTSEDEFESELEDERRPLVDIDPLLAGGGIRLPNNRRLCNKDPFVMKTADLLWDIFPKAKFIFMIRDGRAVVNSVVSRKVTITGWNIQDFKQSLTMWNNGISQMFDICQKLGPNTCYPVYYEKLVLEPRKTIRGILRFLDLPWTPRVLNHNKFVGKPGGISISKLERSSDQVIKPINTEALDKWKHNIPKNIDVASVAPMLLKLNYSIGGSPNYGTAEPYVLENNDKIQSNQEYYDERIKNLNLKRIS